MAKNKFRTPPYTPGPWRVTPFSSVVGIVIMAQPDTTKDQFNIGMIHGGRTVEEMKGNAVIVQRAPEVFEMMKKLTHLVARTHMLDCDIHQEAIALITEINKEFNASESRQVQDK